MNSACRTSFSTRPSWLSPCRTWACAGGMEPRRWHRRRGPRGGAKRLSHTGRRVCDLATSCQMAVHKGDRYIYLSLCVHVLYMYTHTDIYIYNIVRMMLMISMKGLGYLASDFKAFLLCQSMPALLCEMMNPKLPSHCFRMIWAHQGFVVFRDARCEANTWLYHGRGCGD